MLKELKEKMPETQAWDIVNYVKAMMAEFDPTKKTKKALTQQLILLSKHWKHQKSFKDMTRDDILSYLNSCRQPEEMDPLHQWKGSYNVRLVAFKKFFRWLYYPNLSRKERIKAKPVPSQIDNLYKLERKEESVYMPSDLWTPEEDMIFLKYCPYKVIKCYHAMSRDTSRPHELLNRNADDVILKFSAGAQYGEIVGSGKTTQRPCPYTIQFHT
jgi:integrase family protein with SAM-like domain